MASPNAFGIVQSLPTSLYASIGTSDMAIVVSGFYDLDGNPLTMANFGSGGIGYLTLEPRSQTNQEIVSFAGIINNGDGTFTVNLSARGLKGTYPYASGGIAFNHNAQAEVIVSNNPQVYQTLVSKENDGIVTGKVQFDPNGLTPNNNPGYLSQPPSFSALDLIDEQEAQRLDAIVLAEAEAYADRVAGLSSGIGGKPMTFTLPDISTNITPIPVYTNQEALIFAGKNATATTLYLQDVQAFIQSRDVTLDWASASSIASACLIGGSLFLLLFGVGSYRVYKYDATNLALGGTLVTFVGGSLGTQAGLIMTTNGTDFFFNYDAGNTVNDNDIARYTYSGTTFTYNSLTTMTAGAGYFSEGFGVDAALTYFGFSLANKNIKKFNSSGTNTYTSGLFTFVAGYQIFNWGDTFYYSDVNANQNVIYSKVYIPGTDLNSTQVTSDLFTYGESIAFHDYVFQATGNEVLYQLYPSNNANIAFSNNTSKWFGASFTVDPRSSIVTKIKFDLARDGGGGAMTGVLVGHIYAMSGSVPVGPALYTSTNTVSAALTTGQVFTEFDFTNAILTPGTTYAMVIDVSGVTNFNSNHINMYESTGSNQSFTSTDGGTTWTNIGNDVALSVYQPLIANDVYKVDESHGNLTTLLNAGPYKGFALESGILGEIHPVQIFGIVNNFPGPFTKGGNIYIDPATPGAITQSVAGRVVGIANSAIDIQMNEMRTITEPISAPSYIPADGFLIVAFAPSGGGAGAGGGIIVSPTNFILDSGVTYDSNTTSGSGAGGEIDPSYLTIPVKQGAGWVQGGTQNFTATFIRLING